MTESKKTVKKEVALQAKDSLKASKTALSGEPSIESSKELGRIVILAAVSYILTEFGINNIVSLIFGTKLDPMVKVRIINFLTIALKIIDKYLHKKGIKTGLEF